jgi:hypothetical protein
MRRIILMALLAVFSSSAMAEWVKVGYSKSDGGMTIYVNPSSMRRSGDTKKIWVQTDYQTLQEVEGKQFWSAKIYSEINCDKTSERALNYSWHSEHMGGGKTVYANSTPADWDAISPDSIAEPVFDYACLRSNPLIEILKNN